MPKSNIKVKSGKTYPVKYRVVGSMNDFSTEQLKIFAEKYIRSAARSFVLGKLNEVEPSIADNIEMHKSMLESGFDPAMVEKFFAAQKYNLTIPDTFEVTVADLTPESSGRGKKAADVFSFESVEEEDEEEEENNEVTA